MVIALCGLLLKPQGQLRVAIPSEGTILWKLGWKMTTGVEFKWKYGLDYGTLMRYEHVNNAQEIENIPTTKNLTFTPSNNAVATKQTTLTQFFTSSAKKKEEAEQ